NARRAAVVSAVWFLPVLGIDRPRTDAVAKVARDARDSRVVRAVWRAEPVRVDAVTDLSANLRAGQLGQIGMRIGVVEHPVSLLPQRGDDVRIVLGVLIDQE